MGASGHSEIHEKISYEGGENYSMTREKIIYEGGRAGGNKLFYNLQKI